MIIYSNSLLFLAKFRKPVAASILSLISLIVMMQIQFLVPGRQRCCNISGVLCSITQYRRRVRQGLSYCNKNYSFELSNVKALQMDLGENIPPAGRSFSVLLPNHWPSSHIYELNSIDIHYNGWIITIFVGTNSIILNFQTIGSLLFYSLGYVITFIHKQLFTVKSGTITIN